MATRAVIVAGIVLTAASGLAGFTWVTTGLTARTTVAGADLPYGLFSLIGAVAESTLVLVTAALVFIYLLVRKTPVDLHIQRSGPSGRSSAPLVKGTFDWFASRSALVPPPDAPVNPCAEAGYGTTLAEVHEVLLFGDRIRVTLAEGDAPDLMADLFAPVGQRYRHHLASTRVRYGTPEDGIAFACLGSNDRGCLFLDLGKAPGPVCISGEPAAAARLTESIAHQLCTTSNNRNYTVVIIGDALPEPHPPGATWLASLDRLGALRARPSQVTAIVFCTFGTPADAQALTDHVADARCQVVPVVLNGPDEGAWSIAAAPVAEVSDTV
jgi:hypothetical protein